MGCLILLCCWETNIQGMNILLPASCYIYNTRQMHEHLLHVCLAYLCVGGSNDG